MVNILRKKIKNLFLPQVHKASGALKKGMLYHGNRFQGSAVCDFVLRASTPLRKRGWRPSPL